METRERERDWTKGMSFGIEIFLMPNSKCLLVSKLGRSGFFFTLAHAGEAEALEEATAHEREESERCMVWEFWS